jgi:hypothetical protein
MHMRSLAPRTVRCYWLETAMLLAMVVRTNTAAAAAVATDSEDEMRSSTTSYLGPSPNREV